MKNPGRRIRRALDSSHKRLTAAALATGALMVVALVGPFSDRTFYCFLVAFVGFSVLAINAANKRVNQVLRELDDPDPFNERLIPVNHAPAAYNVTVVTPGRPERNLRGLSPFQFGLLMHELHVPLYEASADHGATTVDDTRITWKPSTTDTGETR